MAIDSTSHSSGQPGSNKFTLAVEVIHRHLVQQGITEISINNQQEYVRKAELCKDLKE